MSATRLRGTHRPDVRVEVLTPLVTVDGGRDARLRLRVHNLASVIRALDVEVLGTDPTRVATEGTIDLFPGDAVETSVVVRVPQDHPAGRHHVALRVSDATGGVVAAAEIEVLPRPGLALVAEPTTLETGTTGSFLLTLRNLGNTELRPALLAQDPERLVEVTFAPPDPVVPGGTDVVVRATARGPRPLIGMPAVRVLDVLVTAEGVEANGVMALVQRPRISRRVVALVGLLLMVSLFAGVITLALQRVADLSERNELLVQQGLGFDDPGAGRDAPGGATGTIASSTGGPIEGAAVELYEQDDPIRPFQTTVSDVDGAFVFSGLPAGEYLVRTEVAGYGARWFPDVADVADAETVTVEVGETVERLSLSLTGRPGGVSGEVIGVDVEGAVLSVQLPADTILPFDGDGATDGSEPPPVGEVASVVVETELDAIGRFELLGLDTPADYEVVVRKPGFATVSQSVRLGPGEERRDLELFLSRGLGVILGEVVDTGGDPLGGVDVTATDGTTTFVTRSLSNEEDAGRFELRGLDLPGTYTLTLEAPGFVTETRTVGLEGAGEDPPPTEVVVPLTADSGSVEGTVVDATGAPVPSATVTVSGPDLERDTRTLSTDDVGAWVVDDLPTPSTYTVRVTAEGYLTRAVSVELRAGVPVVGPVDVVLVAADASVRGLVTDTDGAPVAGVRISLESADVERTTVSADDPLGEYVLDRLPRGVYTLTFERPGSAVQTLLVQLDPGEDLRVGTVELEPQAAIAGTVVRDGQVAADVEVTVYRSADYPGIAVATTTTDVDGRFSLVGLEAPERYVVEFRSPAGEVLGSRTVDLAPGETEDLAVGL